MKINRLRLENIRSYEEQTIEFPEGTILIHGENGAGKTSLLMGLFGGLFLSNITNVGSNNFTLSDLVRRGADTGRVELDFEVDGNEYAVEWTMPGEDSASASSATLTSPALSEPISGITTVQREVTTLLGMDEDDFSSSAYVKQGEIDRLIEAGDRGAMIDSLLGLDQIEEYIERAKMGRRGARRAYERCQERRRGQEENLDDYDRDEDGYVSEVQRLNAKINENKQNAESYQNHIDDKLTPRLNSITDTIEEYDTLSKRLAKKTDQIEEAEENRTETRRSKQNSDDDISAYRAKVGDLRDEIDDLDGAVEYDLSAAESTAEALDAVQDDLMDAQQEKTERENDYQNAKSDLVDARDELQDVVNDLDAARTNETEKAAAIEDAENAVENHETDLRERLGDLAETLADFEIETDFGDDDDRDIEGAASALAPLAQQQIPGRRDALNDEVNDLTGEIGRLESKAERLTEEATELRALGDAGECPKCGQSVDESHVEDEITAAESERTNVEATINEKSEKKERLQRRSGQLSGIRGTVNDAIEFRNGTLADARTTVEELRNERDDITDEIDELEAEQSALETALDEHETSVSEREQAFEQAQGTMEDIGENRSTVRRADRKYDAIETHQNSIDQEQQTISHATDRIESLDTQLETLRDERDDIEEDLSDHDLDELRERKTAFEEEITTYKNKRDECQRRVEDLRDECARVDTQLSNLRSLREKIDELERRERWADSVREDIERTLSIYNEVQSDLRETYLGYLNEYANDIFKEIYKNSSYQQVIITEEHDDTYDTYDYDIRLLRDDGTTEDPANASGGERAVVNLALRAGIYRLIAQIRGADRSTLPPFILDEPTTFLDEGHVGQLEEMLETVKEWDVTQVFVVSHDESLIHGADHECLVTKDGDSTSSVEMRLAGSDYEGSPSDGDAETEVVLSDGSGAASRGRHDRGAE